MNEFLGVIKGVVGLSNIGMVLLEMIDNCNVMFYSRPGHFGAVCQFGCPCLAQVNEDINQNGGPHLCCA